MLWVLFCSYRRFLVGDKVLWVYAQVNVLPVPFHTMECISFCKILPEDSSNYSTVET